ncbi:hypothetical protein [Pseudomonas frederiksbergensis]|uniref:Uncharacterized protein n=1 Tax=Pseudomonas frederiksbergensis TaxID=104087 RepID=A0A423KNQ5_9PSED|nr:hypothetical protein [Pseudomonas frederiksbergensis]RON56039.1 hypothetical protein BK665_08775 [Pseudomonas frederiksbergensis]
MSTFITNSFIATLEIPGQHLNLLNTLYGGPAMATELLGSGGFFTGRPQQRDDSHLLGYRSKAEVSAIEPLQLFFLGSQGGYAIFTLDGSGHLHSCISKNRVNLLGAVAADSGERTLFNMTNDQGRIITLDDLAGDKHLITLKTEDEKHIGGLTLKGSNYHYLSEVSDNYKMTFELKILERL